MSSASEYAAKSLSAAPYFDCGLSVGDTIEWVNDYGAVWEHKIIGFSEPNSVGFVHFDSGAYWFPHNLKCITKVNGVKFEHTSLLTE